MKRIQRILAAGLCFVLLLSLMGVAEEVPAPEAPAPQAEEALEVAPEQPVEPAPEPEPQVTEAPEPEPEPVEPAPETQAPTEAPEPEPTEAPEEPQVPAEPEVEPSPAELLARRLGMSEEELAALLGVAADELRALDEAALEALYAASQESSTPQEEAPDAGSVAPTFTIDEAGVLTACSGEHIDAVIPEGVKAIGKNAFGGQAKLRSVTIPASVRLIDEYAFAGCEALEKVEIEAPDKDKLEEEGLVEIGLRAFFGCKKIKEIVLPETLETVGDEAFRDCAALEKVEFPAEAKLGREVFAGCERLNLPADESPEMPEATEAPVVEEGAADDLTPETPEAEPAESWPVVLVPKAITAPGTLTIGVGESVTPDVQYVASFDGDVLSFASDDKTVAKVNSTTGKITGKNKGTANITVTSSAGAKATIVVNVLKAPGSVTLNKTKGTLGVGQKVELTATLPKNTASKITWSSSNEKIATVENGVITAVKKGTATITAKTFNGKTATFALTVKPAATAVAIRETLTLCANPHQTYEMTATLTPSGAKSDISYASSSPSVVSVEGATLTALRTGSARITVTARNGEQTQTAVCEVKVVAGPSTITFENPIEELGVGESHTLEYTFNRDSELAEFNTWESSKSSVLKVKNGKLTGKQVGEEQVTLTAANGTSKTLTVQVKKAPGSVTLNKTKGTLGVGQKVELTATLPKNTASKITWSSSNEKIATVDNGVITAVKKGTATITAKTFNGKTATFALTVKPAATAVSIRETLVLCANPHQTYEMAATLTPSGAKSDISYASSSPSVVSVEGATLTALRTGSARITVTARNGEQTQTAVCEVKVVSGPSVITFANPIEELGVGESHTLEYTFNRDSELAEFNTWESSKSSVLKVKNGKLTGKNAGEAIVTLTAANGTSKTLTVQVKNAPSKVTLNKTKGTLGVGQKVELTATLPKNTASKITWKSDKPGVATVENGVVTAVAKGTATITAKTFNGKTATFTATVKPAPTAITMAEDLALAVGQSYTLETTLEPSGSATSKTFSTSQSAVTVDDKGVVTAVRTGFATVRVQTHNGKTATCLVTVYPAPKTVSITNAPAKLGVGETYQLNAQLDTNAALLAHCTWKSSNTGVLKVSKTGKLTAVKAGTAKITVTTGNKEAKTSVSVEVVAAPSKLTMSQKEAMVARTRTLQLTAKLPKGTASQITWTSSDESVATVDGNGLVTALSLGETDITAKTFNNKSAKCTVKVLTKVPVEISTPTITLNGVTVTSKTKTLDLRSAVDLSWACEESGLYFDVQVSDEYGSTLLSRRIYGNSSTRIAESQMTSGRTYTVSVKATYNTQYETGESSATAKFRYIDPLTEFLYTTSSSGATITEYIGTATELIVPTYLGGRPVTRVATGAFNGSNCAKITSVTWPAGVAFEVDSVTGLKKCADKNGFLVFNNILCKYFGTATTAKVPSGVVRINDGAFSGNTTVTTVKLPATVETIGARAFYKCTKLKSMVSY